MREVLDPEEAAALCAPDTLCRWALRDRPPGVRVFRDVRSRAVAVAAPGLSGRDRIAVRGPVGGPTTALVREVLDAVGAGYRPLGEREVIRHVARGIAGRRAVADFGWMECRAVPEAVAAGAAGGAVRWLAPECAARVDALLDAGFPSSSARARHPDDVRWAGWHDAAGALRAVAALAWSAPGVGFVAGVAVDPGWRGRGLGRRVCGFVAAEAVARHGRAALIVDDANTAAVRGYRAVGFGYRPLAAAIR